MKQYIYELMTDQRKDTVSRILQAVLFLLSVIYTVAVILMQGLYKIGVFRTHRLSKPVISVGNITVGGVGKTPLVISIVEFLRREGLRPAVLIRGYMAGPSGESDEGMLLKESLPDVPILVGADRVKSAQSLDANSVDVFVLDDGFQHWKIARQMDIVAVDATNPFGNGFLLPRGILREPPFALWRAHFFVITKSDAGQNNLESLSERLKVINPQVLAYARHRPAALIDLKKNEVLPLSSIEGQKICSFCSIGDPHSFLNTLSTSHAYVEKNFAFMDHHVYQKAEIQQIIDFCRSNEIKTVVMTQKDAVKVKSLLKDVDNDIQFLTLKIALEFVKGQELLFQNVLNACRIT